MNTEGCPEGWATDQIFRLDNPDGTCDMSVAAYISTSVLVMLAKTIVAVLHVRAWNRRQRKLYAKVDKKKKHYPIVPTLSWIGAIHYFFYFPLTFTNVINARNGWSYALHATGWVAFGVMSEFFFLKIVRLGRRLVPIIKEKKLNELIEQQLRDEEDPPTWSSIPKPKNALAAFTSNPMYEDDPPTFDDTSSLPYEHVHSSTSTSAAGILGQNLAQGRLLFEKQMMNGRLLIGKQVAHGRMFLNGGKAPEPPTGFSGRPKRAMTGNNGMKKVGADPPPKNPMWEEDPPTTYSILEIVEPQLDRLKRLDLLGQLFFLSGCLAISGQFIVYFFVLTLISPGSYDIARIGFALQAFFLFQHAVNMNWQYRRVIHAVRESKRKSRRNDINIENGVLKLRGQQTTILVLSAVAGAFYILLAIGTLQPFWWIILIVMFAEIFANILILRTFSTRLKGKINELKKQQQNNLKSPGNAHNGNHLAGNANGAGGGNGGQIPLGNGNGAGGANGNGIIPIHGGRENGGVANNLMDDGNDSDTRRPIYKSEVAHIRDSTKFVSSSSRRPDDKEGPTESTIDW